MNTGYHSKVVITKSVFSSGPQGMDDSGLWWDFCLQVL